MCFCSQRLEWVVDHHPLAYHAEDYPAHAYAPPWKTIFSPLSLSRAICTNDFTVVRKYFEESPFRDSVKALLQPSSYSPRFPLLPSLHPIFDLLSLPRIWQQCIFYSGYSRSSGCRFTPGLQAPRVLKISLVS